MMKIKMGFEGEEGDKKYVNGAEAEEKGLSSEEAGTSAYVKEVNEQEKKEDGPLRKNKMKRGKEVMIL